MILRKPQDSEFPSYFQGYVALSKELDPLKYLEKLHLVEYLKTLSADNWLYSYAEGKWTVKESVLHLLDSERIFCYRALRFARNDHTVLSGFDQDLYVPESEANGRTSDSLLAEYKTVRKATISLFQNLSEAQIARSGKVGDTNCTVRALAYIIAGHEIHHQNIFNERYFIKS